MAGRIQFGFLECLGRDDGQDVIEYSLLLGLACLLIAAIFANLSLSIHGIWESANATMQVATGDAKTGPDHAKYQTSSPAKPSTPSNLPSLGVLSLGLFIGVPLGYTLLLKNPTWKAAIAVIGCAVGGIPMRFLGEIGDLKWFYPIGLLVGLLVVRMPIARAAIMRSYGNPNPQSRVNLYFALSDVVIIIAIVLVAFSPTPLSQTNLVRSRLPSALSYLSISTSFGFQKKVSL